MAVIEQWRQQQGDTIRPVVVRTPAIPSGSGGGWQTTEPWPVPLQLAAGPTIVYCHGQAAMGWPLRAGSFSTIVWSASVPAKR